MKHNFLIFIRIHVYTNLLIILGSIFFYSCSSSVETSLPVLAGYTLDSESQLVDKSQNINYGPEIFNAAIRLILFSPDNSKASCTGSVVSHNTVLTSAHCIDSNVTSIIGFNTNPNGSLKGKMLVAKAFYTNPHFTFMINDLAAVVFEDNSFDTFLEVYPGFLETPENVSTFLEDISNKTNTTEKDINKHGAIFIGYGSKPNPDQQDDSLFTKIKKVGKALISLNDPSTIYSSNDKSINPNSSFNIFNLGEPGDSGGPLIYKGKLVGITMGINNYDHFSVWSYINSNKDEVSCFFKRKFDTSKTNYNWTFLSKDLENQAVISGINSGIRTVELNGKIKVIQKYTVNTALDPEFKNQPNLDYPSSSTPIYRSSSNAVIYYSPSKILSDNSTLKVGDIIVGYMSLDPVVYQYRNPNSKFTIGSFVKQVLESSSYWERKKLPWIVIEDNQRYVVRSDLRLRIDPPYDKNI